MQTCFAPFFVVATRGRERESERAREREREREENRDIEKERGSKPLAEIREIPYKWQIRVNEHAQRTHIIGTCKQMCTLFFLLWPVNVKVCLPYLIFNLFVHYASIVCILSQLSLVITLYFNVYGQTCSVIFNHLSWDVYTFVNWQVPGLSTEGIINQSDRWSACTWYIMCKLYGYKM